MLAGVTRLVTDGARNVARRGPWQDQLRLLAYAFRAFSLAHPRLMGYAFTSADFIQRDGLLWTLCAVLTAGLPDDEVERPGRSSPASSEVCCWPRSTGRCAG